jgi:hypothetical protein
MPNFNDLIKTLTGAIDGFNDRLPALQKGVLGEVMEQIKGFDVKNGKVANSVKNIRLLNSIKNRLRRVILTPEYKSEVRDYLKVFNEIDKFHRSYFRETEKNFKPPAVVAAIKEQTIDDVVKKLTEAGIGVNVGDRITDILRQNITSGVEYRDLAEQLRESILKTGTPGILERYVKQIATDAANQYSAQYMNTVSGDLGYEWFRYQGKDILTTRHFCDAMTDRQYFHVSEVPDLLEAKDLYYSDEGQQVKVPIYARTGLPHGLIEGTNVENFFVRRGGYNCGHQIFPVIERIVPKDIVARVKATAEYQRFKGIEPVEKPKPVPKPVKEIKFAPKDKTIESMKVASKKMMETLAGRKFAEVIVSPQMTAERFEKYNKQLEKLGNEYDAFKDRKIASEAELSYRSDKKTKLSFESKENSYGFVQFSGVKGSIIEANFGHRHGSERPMTDERIAIAFSTLTHEFAHTITKADKGARTLILTGLPARGKAFWKELDVLRKEYHKKLKALSADGKRQDYYDYSLGQYASTNHNEFMAEAFTEYKLSSQPSEMAVKVGKLIDKYYKKK